MPSITIRNLDETLKSRLRIQAATHGRSMEDEARDILRSALNRDSPAPGNLARAIRLDLHRWAVNLPDIPREPTREPPSFD